MAVSGSRQIKKKKTVKGGWRLLCLGLVFVAWFALIAWRLFAWQIQQHESLYNRALNQRHDTVEISAVRGAIVDRNGKALASSAERNSIIGNPRQVKEPDKLSRTLAPLLGESVSELFNKLTADRGFVWLKRKVESETAQSVVKTLKDSELKGITLVSEPQRFYPNAALASHVLGYTDLDEKGLDGIELKQNEVLRGKPGRAFLEVDGLKRTINRQDVPATNGAHIETTIDLALQHEVRKILLRGIAATKARSISALVVEPNTGEILSLVNVPDFNPNERPKNVADKAAAKSEGFVRRNRAITDFYEPGSVFKIVTYSGVLEEGLVKPDDKVDCQGGAITLHGRTIHDAHLGTGVVTVAEALAKSSNVGAIKMAQKLGRERLAQYVDRFGFGKKTEIDLPGESRGMVNPLKNWHGTSYASIAMGHEVGVTALQAVMAMATIANNGLWVQPHIVRRVMDENNRVIQEFTPQTRRVISESTARTVAGMLEDVVDRGTARGKVRLAGYKAAGKTGTAQKVLETGGYSKTDHIASFAGFVPAQNPRFAIIVVLDDPKGAHQGGQVAAPLFSEIAEAALATYLVPPDSEEYRQKIAELKKNAAVENSNPAPVKATPTPAVKELAKVPEPKTAPSPTTAEKKNEPKPAATPDKVAAKKSDAKSREVAVNQNSTTKNPTTNKIPAALIPSGSGVMPDLTGRGMRAVAQTCGNLDLKLVVKGSGNAIRQFPSPGARVRPGDLCKVEFQ